MAAGRCPWDMTVSWSCPSQVKMGSWEKGSMCHFPALMHGGSDRLLLPVADAGVPGNPCRAKVPPLLLELWPERSLEVA